MAARRDDLIDPTRPAGVNVIGFHCTASGLGVAARSIVRSLRAAGVPTNALDVAPTWSPRFGAPEPVDELYETTIIVATAERMEQIGELFAAEIAGSTTVIGYWFWELARIDRRDLRSLTAVDRIWTATQFVAEAFTASVDARIPVTVAPFMLEPSGNGGDVRRDKRPDAPVTFMNSFDHLSVIERKNPFDVIDAFRLAIPDDGARLVFKTINADVLPESARRLHDAIGGDPRITVVDGYLDDSAHAALLAEADCFVSLHRSEGLGLHLAEAMWTGIPVIATGYSGNTEFMDPTSAALVDYHLVDIERSVRTYPAGYQWAQPDVAHAAEWIRRMAAEPNLRRRIGVAGRRAMESQPSLQERGQFMADQIYPPTAPPPTARGVLRPLVRAIGAPARNYVNAHFEMTKQEVREQVAALREAGVSNGSIDRLAEVSAEAAQHQMQTVAKLRAEVAQLRDELGEARQAIDELGRVIADLVERLPAERP